MASFLRASGNSVDDFTTKKKYTEKIKYSCPKGQLSVGMWLIWVQFAKFNLSGLGFDYNGQHDWAAGRGKFPI